MTTPPIITYIERLPAFSRAVYLWLLCYGWADGAPATASQVACALGCEAQ